MLGPHGRVEEESLLLEEGVAVGITWDSSGWELCVISPSTSVFNWLFR